MELAQLVRALVCGTRGHGFDSHIPPHFFLGRLNPFNVIEHPDAMGCSQVVRHGTLTPALVGSNPATPAIYGSLAQLVEHLTFNQGVRSSNLR